MRATPTCRLLLLAGLLGGCVLGAAAGARAQEPYPLSIATGGVTGIYYQIGAAICRLLRDHPPTVPIACTTNGSQGSVANLIGVRFGQAPVAVVQADVLHDAAMGTGAFANQRPDGGVRALFSPVPEAFMVLTPGDRRVTSVADLRGRRVSVGAPASGSEVTLRRLLDARGWSPGAFAELIDVQNSLQAVALCRGLVDAAAFVAANPAPILQEATFACDARFVPLDPEFTRSMVERYPYYVPAVVPGGLYPNNPAPVPTVGVRAVVVASAGTPDEVVHAVTRTVFENLAEFRTLHLAFASVEAEDMLHHCLFAPVHPGAARYYREAGLRAPPSCLPG
jgi:TRAP transporter TAXI family solute receptor